MVETAVEGLRVRGVPGTTGELLATLPSESLGLVQMGPLPADGHAWYQLSYTYLNEIGVTDGGVGWIAAGTRQSPWLVPTARESWGHGDIRGFASTGSATEGPVEVADWNHGIRWAAVGEGCRLDVALASEIGSVSVVSTAVDGFAEGEVSELFIDNPEFVGNVTIVVSSDCAWAVSVVQYIG